MDVEDHKKTPPSAGGHEGHGFHVCHKCGWPFPNPHPSAKHRRAHKRVCGKVEGYKIIDSEADHISDDDHLSDDDNMKNSSPKVEKEYVKELGSSDGIGLKSIKSEDDVFSDAITEFSDSGITPTIEEHLERVSQLDKSAGEELVNELNATQLSEVHGNDDTKKQTDGLITSKEISNAEAIGSVMNPLESTNPVSDNRVEEASCAFLQTAGQEINSSPIVFISEDIDTNAGSGKQKEIVCCKAETNVEVKESVNEVESLTESVALLSTSAGEATLSESKSEADRKVSDTMTLKPKLNEADGNISHAMTGDKIVEREKEPSNKLEAEMEKFSTVVEIVEQEKELSNVLQAEMTKDNLSPQVEPRKCIDASVSTRIEANSAKDAIGVGHEGSAKVDLKEGDDNEADILSVAETLSALENPESITGDIKDNEVLRSSFPLDIVDAKVNRSVEDENNVNPNSASSVPVGSLGTSHSDFNSLDDSLEKEGVSASIRGEVDTSGFTVISEDDSGTNGLEGSPGTSGFETQKIQPNYSIEGFQPHSADEKSLHDGVSAPSSVEHSDMIHAVSFVDEETCRQTTNLTNFETSDDTATTKSNQVMTENGTNHSLDDDNTCQSKRCTDEGYVETSQGIEIDKWIEVQRSGGAVGVDPDFSPVGHSATSGKQAENSKEIETQRSTAAGSQLKPEDNGVASEKDSKDSEEAAALPVTSTISNQSSATVENKIARAAVASESLLDEGDDKLTKGSSNISAVDSSRTVSLDGNWGSVSVVSSQSDGTALADAETLSSANTQAPEKSEGTLPKLLTSAQECHPDKSEDVEPPSFMTLIESGIERDKKVVASEVHDVQKTEQPKSEALQAGWFPSLTNVINESEGRKENEDIIAKVTSWSTGKQHSPLKNLLSEAQESAAQEQDPPVNQGNVSKNNGAVVTTVSAIIGSETPGDNTVKREMEKEWNSPARYPVEIKKEKRKVKPYWVPFVCCTSVHQDM